MNLEQHSNTTNPVNTTTSHHDPATNYIINSILNNNYEPPSERNTNKLLTKVNSIDKVVLNLFFNLNYINFLFLP